MRESTLWSAAVTMRTSHVRLSGIPQDFLLTPGSGSKAEARRLGSKAAPGFRPNRDSWSPAIRRMASSPFLCFHSLKEGDETYLIGPLEKRPGLLGSVTLLGRTILASFLPHGMPSERHLTFCLAWG